MIEIKRSEVVGGGESSHLESCQGKWSLKRLLTPSLKENILKAEFLSMKCASSLTDKIKHFDNTCE